jgi:hypothetical protein
MQQAVAVVCFLQVGDDDLLHLEHGVCHSFGFFRVSVTHQLAQRFASAEQGAGGVDSVWKQEKPEATLREMLEKPHRAPASSNSPRSRNVTWCMLCWATLRLPKLLLKKAIALTCAKPV